MLEKHKRLFEVVMKTISSNNITEICDYGCGDGEFLEIIREHNASVKLTGIDFFRKHSIIARKINDCRYLEREEDLLQSGNKYDLIISSFSLHHFQHPVKELRMINTLLKEQGTIILFDHLLKTNCSTKIVKSLDSFISALNGTLGNDAHRQFYSMEEVRDLVEVIPVKIISAEEVAMNFTEEKLKLFQDFDLNRISQELDRLRAESNGILKEIAVTLAELQQKLLTKYGIDYGDFLCFVLQKT